MARLAHPATLVERQLGVDASAAHHGRFDLMGAALDDRVALQARPAARVPELQARVRAGSERLADLIRTASATRSH